MPVSLQAGYAGAGQMGVPIKECAEQAQAPRVSSLCKRQYDECVSIQAVCALRSTEGPPAVFLTPACGRRLVEGAVQRGVLLFAVISTVAVISAVRLWANR